MNRKLSRKITDQHRGIYTCGCSIPTGAFYFHPTGEKTVIFSDPRGGIEPLVNNPQEGF